MTAGRWALPAPARVAPWRRRAASATAELATALDAVARALRSGASVTQALADAAQAHPGGAGADLAALAAAPEAGVPLVVALARWRDARRTSAVRLAAGALTVAATSGGERALAVEHVAATLHERVAAEADVATASVQARLSAVVVGTAPVVFAGLASAVDPRIAGVLAGTTVGRVCLVVGLGLDAAGWWWMAAQRRRVLGAWG